MTDESVSTIAAKYDVDISDLNIKIDRRRDGVAGITGPNGAVTLTRAAFRNEEHLARTLAHERYHVVEQLRQGMPYPRTLAEAEPYENAAQAFEDTWWAQHARQAP